jgi:hypothetical protein
MTDIYTRAEYMKDAQHEGKGPSAAHRRYFGQFVTPGTIARVVNTIGSARLMQSTDPHLNDIPLIIWDKLTPTLPGSGGFSKAGDYYTLANGVCLAKEAARQYIESQTKGA